MPACWWSRIVVAGVRQSTSLSIKQRVQARWSLQLFVLIGFLGGQPINLHMQPAFPTSSRNRGAPVSEVFRRLVPSNSGFKLQEWVSPVKDPNPSWGFRGFPEVCNRQARLLPPRIPGRPDRPLYSSCKPPLRRLPASPYMGILSCHGLFSYVLVLRFRIPEAKRE